jgi:predicted transcriptional regulator of viral defense system
MRTFRRLDPIDAQVAELARRQHGVVERQQLVALGLSLDAIDHRVECGRLLRLHRGVYAVGHRKLTGLGVWMAAVLAAGPGAVLSHRSAGALWGVRAWSGRRVEIAVPRRRRVRDGLVLHETQLPEDERDEHEGIPVTTPARTLLDLAAVLDSTSSPARPSAPRRSGSGAGRPCRSSSTATRGDPAPRSSDGS